MVKVKVLTHSTKQLNRPTKFDIYPVYRNPDPSLHPLQREREYQRALVAAKVTKIFSKPFLGNLQGHSDSISSLAKDLSSTNRLISGSFNGEVIGWNIIEKKKIFCVDACEGAVTGLCLRFDGERFIATQTEKSCSLYGFPSGTKLTTFNSSTFFTGIAHAYNSDNFCTAGKILQIWDYQRSTPIQKYSWGSESLICAKYNTSQTDLIVTTGFDRAMTLFDVRTQNPLYKAIMANKCQTVCWNPIEPVNFSVGCNDANCYTFDMRKLDSALFIHKDHLGPITSIDYSPIGKEFVSGSTDKTLRIFEIQGGKSREVYHGRRMQQIRAVLFSMDAQFLFGGSEDMNIRIWKVKADAPLNIMGPRQERSINYRQALLDKYQHVKEVKRIKQHRHLPKYILNAKEKQSEMKKSHYRKQENMEINNPGQWQIPKPERQAKILNTE